jgi:hypothetical protein
MRREKPYHIPHKGLRNALSQLSLLAGKTDYSNPKQVEELYHLGTDVFIFLTDHAASENDVSLAELELRCPGASKHDMDDHVTIHVAQHKLENLLSKIYADSKAGKDATDDGEEFYLSLSEFTAYYLAHTATEERVTQELLLKHFTDEELFAHRGKIMSKISPPVLLAMLRFIVPAQNHAERVGLLSGFKKMAPGPFFNQGMVIIEKAMDPVEFKLLNEALNISVLVM